MNLLHDTLVRQGDAIFRYRSYLPLLGIPLVAWELSHFRYPLESHAVDVALEILCLALAALGIGIRALVQGYAARGTSGRNTKKQRAGELNTTGAYSLCRNPLYLGNFVVTFAVLLFLHSWTLLLIYGLAFALYYERVILREEDYLEERFGEAYRAWAARTPVFLPRLSGWRQPDRAFSWRKVIRREHPTVMAVVAILCGFEVVGDWIAYDRLQIGPVWGVLLGAALLQYLLFRVVKKRTRLLKVA